jgi:hypothetical protein
MDKAQDELKPLTTVQLLDDAIWREIGSHEPQPPEVFIEALSLLLARWMLTRSQAPEMETLTTRCKTRAYVLFNNTPKLGDVTAQRNEELTPAEKDGEYCGRHSSFALPLLSFARRFRFADWLKQLLRREPIFFTPVRAALCESR